MLELGTIRTLALKELWAGEATHFTPWLAQNLNVLGEKLGMDLELEIYGRGGRPQESPHFENGGISRPFGYSGE